MEAENQKQVGCEPHPRYPVLLSRLIEMHTAPGSNTAQVPESNAEAGIVSEWDFCFLWSSVSLES